MGDRFAAYRDDLVHDLLRGARRTARAVEPDPQVIDDDPGTLGRQGARMGAAQTPARPGDDGHAPRAHATAVPGRSVRRAFRVL